MRIDGRRSRRGSLTKAVVITAWCNGCRLSLSYKRREGGWRSIHRFEGRNAASLLSKHSYFDKRREWNDVGSSSDPTTRGISGELPTRPDEARRRLDLGPFPTKVIEGPSGGATLNELIDGARSPNCSGPKGRRGFILRLTPTQQP